MSPVTRESWNRNRNMESWESRGILRVLMQSIRGNPRIWMVPEISQITSSVCTLSSTGWVTWENDFPGMIYWQMVNKNDTNLEKKVYLRAPLKTMPQRFASFFFEQILRNQIHCLWNASHLAYAAEIYTGSQSGSKQSIRFVLAGAENATSKQISIPKFQLQALWMGAN